MSSRELCIMACVFCRDKQFQEWVAERTQRVVAAESTAKVYITAVCQVSSRSDLDTDEDAAARFHDLVRKPFLEWKESRT